MTFAELKAAARETLWPFGESENLIEPHNKKFVEALNDLQDAVVCLKSANIDQWPQCSSYFNCGMTVIPAPRGIIRRVYTIGKKSSVNGTVSDGTEVGSLDIPATDNQLLVVEDGELVQPPPTLADIVTVADDGLYTVTVRQLNNASTLYPLNSPQYFRTEIIYTDSADASKTVQPAPLIHMNVAANSGVTVISVKGGTAISARISAFNSPQTDGGMEVQISVIKGTQVNNDDWCSKVFYDRVEYCHLERYGRICARSTSGLRAIGDALISALFGWSGYAPKRFYPRPTDSGYEFLAALPQGYHYPQTSTDAGGRSPKGVFAVHNGRIYIAPWIESTETLVVEYVGKKTQWSDLDTVDDDPKFKKAVIEYVGREHYTYYESDDTKKNDFIKNYALTIRELINDCHNRNRTIACEEAGTSLSAATGISNISSLNSGTFYNEQQSYTANCPPGRTGASVTSTVPAGRVVSSLSVADANAQALAQATSDAQSKLSCSTDSSLFLNAQQTYTANCPAASGATPAAVGNTVTVTIPAGSFQSTVSQALADAAALFSAQEQANAQLSCTYYNAPQTVTADCPSGSTGTQTSATVAAGQYTDTTQQGADAKAYADAQSQAQAALSCSISTSLIGNTAQQANRTGSIVPSGCSRTFNYNITSSVAANTYSARATAATQAAVQAQVNAQAQAAATAAANLIYTQQLNAFIVFNCRGNQSSQ